MPITSATPKYLSPGRAAQRYGLSRTTLNRLIARGDLVARRCGYRTLVEAEHADAYFAALPAAEFRHRPGQLGG